MSERRDRFIYQEGEFTVAPCTTCARKSPWGPTCEAFPNGIPEEILDGSDQHRTPVTGDGGLTYVKEG